MIRRTAAIIVLLVAFVPGIGSGLVHAEGKTLTACEKKADKKKIADPKKRASYIKKCEKKQPK